MWNLWLWCGYSMSCMSMVILKVNARRMPIGHSLFLSRLPGTHWVTICTIRRLTLTVADVCLMLNTHRRRRRDSTVVSCRRCEHTRRQSWPILQFLCCWAIEVGDKWRHNDVVVEKVIQNSRQTAMESVRSVSQMSTESVGSRRELVANSVHTVDADATQLHSWISSASARCVLGLRLACFQSIGLLVIDPHTAHYSYYTYNIHSIIYYTYAIQIPVK